MTLVHNCSMIKDDSNKYIICIFDMFSIILEKTYNYKTRFVTYAFQDPWSSSRTALNYDIHCNENPIYVFLFLELRGLSPNVHIHVPVSDLYIPRIGPHISCSIIGRPINGNI